MKDYKELIEKLRMAGRWIKHNDGSEETYLLSVDDCAEIADAIEQLAKERDAAIYEMRREADNCKWCRWHDKDHPIKSCVCPETCCVDGNPDRWEWRGVQK